MAQKFSLVRKNPCNLKFFSTVLKYIASKSTRFGLLFSSNLDSATRSKVMKKIIFCTGLILTLGVFGFGQKQNSRTASSSTSGSGSASSSSKASSDRGLTIDSGTQISGELQNAVDVKRSKVGDQVLLKTTKDIKQNGKTLVPKGSNLIGRITEVQQKTKSNGASRLGMVFDRVQGRNLD